MDLRTFVTWAREQGSLVEVERAVDPCLELARVSSALDGRPVLFRDIEGFPGWRAISGVCARREHFAAALGCTSGELVHRIAAALSHREMPPAVLFGPCQEVVAAKVDLAEVPFPRFHPQAVSYTHLTLPTTPYV